MVEVDMVEVDIESYLQNVDDEEYLDKDDDENLVVLGIKAEDLHPDSILSS